MKIGIGLPNQVRDLNPAIVPRWAAQAEQAGFSTLGTIGRHAYPGLSDTVALAAAAGATSGIGLMSGILLAPTWPGELLAKELAGIDGESDRMVPTRNSVDLAQRLPNADLVVYPTPATAASSRSRSNSSSTRSRSSSSSAETHA